MFLKPNHLAIYDIELIQQNEMKGSRCWMKIIRRYL